MKIGQLETILTTTLITTWRLASFTSTDTNPTRILEYGFWRYEAMRCSWEAISTGQNDNGLFGSIGREPYYEVMGTSSYKDKFSRLI